MSNARKFWCTASFWRGFHTFIPVWFSGKDSYLGCTECSEFSALRKTKWSAFSWGILPRNYFWLDHFLLTSVIYPSMLVGSLTAWLLFSLKFLWSILALWSSQGWQSTPQTWGMLGRDFITFGSLGLLLLQSD